MVDSFAKGEVALQGELPSAPLATMSGKRVAKWVPDMEKAATSLSSSVQKVLALVEAWDRKAGSSVNNGQGPLTQSAK